MISGFQDKVAYLFTYTCKDKNKKYDNIYNFFENLKKDVHRIVDLDQSARLVYCNEYFIEKIVNNYTDLIKNEDSKIEYFVAKIDLDDEFSNTNMHIV